MKTFLNVLYRRILYKIPLKLLLVLLAIFGLLFACTKAGFVDVEVYPGRDNFILKSDYGNPDILCFSNVNKCYNVLYTLNYDGSYSNAGTFNQYYEVGDSGVLNYICNIDGLGFDIVPNNSCTISVYYPDNYTSQQCQTEYNLIPISEVDSAYCESNNLCPSGGTPSDCPNVGVSNVWINDLFHPGAYNIVMNISDEIDWDYAYTNSGNNLNIDVVGYNVDYEAVQSVIDQQNYKPTQEDFQNLILILGPYGKIIIFFVFLFIVWAWIKKPFKSKL